MNGAITEPTLAIKEQFDKYFALNDSLNNSLE